MEVDPRRGKLVADPLMDDDGYLEEATYRLANLLAGNCFDIVFIGNGGSAGILYVKKNENAAVISASLRAHRIKSGLGDGSLITVGGVAEILECDLQTNGGSEEIERLIGETKSPFYGRLVLEEVGASGQIHFQYGEDLAFDGTNQPPISDALLSASLPMIEMVYESVAEMETELDKSLKESNPIYRPVEDWVGQVEAGKLVDYGPTVLSIGSRFLGVSR